VADRHRAGGLAAAGARRAALLAVLWWALLEGAPAFGFTGLIAVAVATAVSLALIPAHRWRLRWAGVPGLLGFFLQQSVLGGVDVARRALHPRLPIAPGFVRRQLRLRAEEPRVMLAWLISLMPGTVSVALGHDAIELHVVDRDLPIDATLRQLEDAVAGAFAPAEEPS
jgi:multicomponent Na+:H+ antiporter subunit E